MPTSIATITWPFVPGSLSTLVEYRLDTSSVWIQPTSPMNPTTTNSYPLVINDNTLYDVRLTTNGVACAPKSMTFTIQAVVNNCCPSGYTLSSDQSYCFKVNTTAATPPSSPENAVSVTNESYSCFGSFIFNPGYNVNGTGTFTQIPYSNAFWVNGPGYPTQLPGTFNGPMNRAGVWATTTTSNQTVGFTVCVNLSATGTYYVAMGCDNFGTIKIDGNTIVQQDVTALQAWQLSNGYGNSPEVTFNIWFIYPVTLTAGQHIIEIIGNNVSGPAGLGCEIYNLTSAQIQAATSYGSMGAGLVFSSKDYIGQPIQIGSGGFGYTCPSGYSLVLCSGPAFCTQTLSTPTIPCTTTTTSTTTSTTTHTTTHTTTTTSSTTTTTTT